MFRSWKKLSAVFILIGIGVLLGIIVASNLNLPRKSIALDDPSKSASLTSSSLPVESELVQFNEQFIKIAERVKPAVVTISTEKIIKASKGKFFRSPFEEFWNDEFFNRFFRVPVPEGELRQYGLGSGVIVNDEGYILTNNHVVEGFDEIKVVLLNKREYDAKIIGRDSKTDIAVIKIEAENLKPAILGNSDEIRVGEWVLAIGSPFSQTLEHTVTAGIISAKGRSYVGLAEYEDFIQTDASINPGNSGGALVNLKGEVIGINTAIVSRTGTYAGIGFAIPVNMAEKVMNDIIEKGRVIRAWLGVYIRSLDQDLANSLGLESPEGALVASVVENSPADKAGLKVYDVIVSFNGEKVKDSAQLRNMVANSDPGTTARLEIIRDNRRKEVRAKLGELESEKELKPIAEKSSLGLGIEVENLNPDIARRLGYRIDEEGVVVIKVIRGSIADRKGVKTGDIIMEINRKRIYSVKDFYSAMRDLKSGDAMMMLIKRGKDQVIVGLKMP